MALNKDKGGHRNKKKKQQMNSSNPYKEKVIIVKISNDKIGKIMIIKL